MKFRLKSVLLIFVVLCGSMAILPARAVMAQANPVTTSPGDYKPDDPCAETPDSPICKDLHGQTGNPIYGKDGILTTIAKIFAMVTGVISVFMIIIAGLRYILSAGDSSKTAQAKNTIMYAAIGLVVASVAASIVQFVLSRM